MHTEWKASYKAVDRNLDLLIAKTVKVLTERS